MQTTAANDVQLLIVTAIPVQHHCLGRQTSSQPYCIHLFKMRHEKQTNDRLIANNISPMSLDTSASVDSPYVCGLKTSYLIIKIPQARLLSRMRVRCLPEIFVFPQQFWPRYDLVVAALQERLRIVFSCAGHHRTSTTVPTF